MQKNIEVYIFKDKGKTRCTELNHFNYSLNYNIFIMILIFHLFLILSGWFDKTNWFQYEMPTLPEAAMPSPYTHN